MFAGKKSAQIREILISESAWEEMTCLFAPSLGTIISKLQLDKIIEHIDKRQARKINTLNDVATSSLNSTDLKDIAQDILEANYFKAATNIYAEKHKRSLLIDLYRKTDQKFTWEDIKLSLEYAKFDSDEIYYQELKWHHHLGYKFNKFMGVFSAVFSGFILILTGYLFISNNLSIKSGLILAFQMFFMFSLGLLYLKRNWPYNAARKITEYLSKK